MLNPDEDRSFFDRERDKLAGEITAGFEELLSSSNILNRKLEEVLGMTREYDSIAALWGSFHELMKGQKKCGVIRGRAPRSTGNRRARCVVKTGRGREVIYHKGVYGKGDKLQRAYSVQTRQRSQVSGSTRQDGVQVWL